MTSFQNTADKAIYTGLTANAALTALLAGGTANPSVYHALAPEQATLPYVVFNAQSPSVPARTMGGGLAYENALYQVKGIVDSPSAGLAGTIAGAIETALGGSLTFTGMTHMLCSREQDIDYQELAAGGKLFQHRGALYRVQATN